MEVTPSSDTSTPLCKVSNLPKIILTFNKTTPKPPLVNMMPVKLFSKTKEFKPLKLTNPPKWELPYKTNPYPLPLMLPLSTSNYITEEFYLTLTVELN